MLVEVVPSCNSSNAPRQLAGNEVWPSPTSPSPETPVAQVPFTNSSSSNPAKRPRIDTTQLSSRIPLRRSPRRHVSSRTDHFSRTPARRSRRFGDICDTGTVPTSPRSPGSPLLTYSPTNSNQTNNSALPFVPIDPNSSHIPSLQPLVNRQTLKELDLDAILRNPQLRAWFVYYDFRMLSRTRS
jgi:hypothetical protein